MSTVWAEKDSGRPRDDWLTVRSGRRRTLSRELQDGHELLQGESEGLLDFHERVTLRNALKNGGQRDSGPADNPDVAAFSRYALRRCTFGPIQLACPEEPVNAQRRNALDQNRRSPSGQNQCRQPKKTEPVRAELQLAQDPSTALRVCDFIVFSQNPMLKTDNLHAKKTCKFKKVTNSQGRLRQRRSPG